MEKKKTFLEILTELVNKAPIEVQELLNTLFAKKIQEEEERKKK